MSINVYNIEQAILDKMNSSSTELELLEYSKMLTQLKTGIVQVVDTYASLPTASASVGNLYYVQDEKTVYWANATLGWFSVTTTLASTLLVMGDDYNGTVPDTLSSTNTSSPIQEFTSSRNWVNVSYGGSFSGGGVKSDGSLWMWGGGASYGLNAYPGTNTSRCGSNMWAHTGTCDWLKVDYCGSYATALKTNGEVWSWGCAACGARGDNCALGSSTCPVQEITSSTWNTICKTSCLAAGIKTNGTMWGWGNGGTGSWGQGDTIHYSSPVQEICSATNWCAISRWGLCQLALKTDGTLWFMGSSATFPTNSGLTCTACSPVQEFTSGTSWAAINIGRGISSTLKTDGTLWAWGGSAFGAGGTGDNTNIVRSSPVQEITSSTNWCCVARVETSFGATMAAKTDGTLWGWGHGGSYNLLLNPSYVQHTSSPVQEMTSHSSGWGDIHVTDSKAAFIRIDAQF